MSEFLGTSTDTFRKTKYLRKVLIMVLSSTLFVTGISSASATDITAPTFTAVADANIVPGDVAAWTAPTATATDDVDGDISVNVTVAYSSTDAGATVTDLTSARAHLVTVGNTVTVTYSVSDAALNPAVESLIKNAVADLKAKILA